MFPSLVRALVILAIVLTPLLPSGRGQSIATKPFITHLLIADIWPSGYSEVWFLDSPVSRRIVSNVDFQAFAPITTIETSDAIHAFVILFAVFTPSDVTCEQQSGRFDARGFPRYWPLVLPPANGPARYVLLSNPLQGLAQTSDLAALDGLHIYFQANRAQLLADARQRAIDGQREAARRAAIPPHVGPPVRFIRVEPAPPSVEK